jgi:hypothetical protein
MTKTPKYAENTQVPIDRSKAEIEHILSKYGADEFGYGIKSKQAVIAFVAHNKQIRFVLPLPNPDDFRKTPKGRTRKGGAINNAFEVESRRRWRSLALVLKAKLEAVSTGIVAFEEEFLPYIVLPGGKTIGEMIIPGLNEIYATGKIPKLLPDLR